MSEATSTFHGNSSVSNSDDGNNMIANGNSIAESSIPATTPTMPTQNQVVDEKENLNTPTAKRDVLDSCMSIIQPDPEGAVQGDEESVPVVTNEPEFVMDIEDKTIKQVPIGTPCQLETQIVAPNQIASANAILDTTTSTSVAQSPTVLFVSTPVQSSQNVSILPAVQNIGNMYSTLNSSPNFSLNQSPYSSMSTIFIPTMTPNFPYGIVVNSGNNWYCGNSMSNSLVTPVQNLPKITRKAPIQCTPVQNLPTNASIQNMPVQNLPTNASIQSMPVQNLANNAIIQSMPVVNQPPIEISYDTGPTTNDCGDSTLHLENIGNFVTIPAFGKLNLHVFIYYISNLHSDI